MRQGLFTLKAGQDRHPSRFNSGKLAELRMSVLGRKQTLTVCLFPVVTCREALLPERKLERPQTQLQ